MTYGTVMTDVLKRDTYTLQIRTHTHTQTHEKGRHTRVHSTPNQTLLEGRESRWEGETHKAHADWLSEAVQAREQSRDGRLLDANWSK